MDEATPGAQPLVPCRGSTGDLRYIGLYFAADDLVNVFAGSCGQTVLNRSRGGRGGIGDGEKMGRGAFPYCYFCLT